MNESCYTQKWVKSHIWTSHVTRANEPCHTSEQFMSHLCTIYVTPMDESCHTYRWVMSHIWMSHVTHIDEWVYISSRHLSTHSCLHFAWHAISSLFPKPFQRTIMLPMGYVWHGIGYVWHGYGIYDEYQVINDKSNENSGMPGTTSKVFRNNLQIVCYPICNWLYLIDVGMKMKEAYTWMRCVHEWCVYGDHTLCL